MIIAEYTIDHPILRETIRRNPEAEITWEDSYPGPEGSEYTAVWIEADDFESVNDALAEDPTVGDVSPLTEVDGRRLYRFELVKAGAEQSIMPVLAEVGGVHLALIADRDGWHNRTRFPDREALERVYTFCRGHGIDVVIDQIFQSSDERRGDTDGLTEAQRTTLTEAVESGYLDIPRQTSLAELGERLGVSESAASERFRRGVKVLIQETLRE